MFEKADWVERLLTKIVSLRWATNHGQISSDHMNYGACAEGQLRGR